MALYEHIPEKWRPYMEDTSKQVEAIGEFLDKEVEEGRIFQPAAENIFRAFSLAKPDDVRVVIIGQDPYPTPGVPTGMAFDVGSSPKIPQSLKNIFTEYEDDLGLPRPESGDLSSWAANGCLLINTALTCEVGKANSHSRIGWQKIVESVLARLVEEDQERVFICWGAHALKVVQRLPTEVPHLHSVHPSPLSAHRGFFGSKPFSQTNAMLAEMNKPLVDWHLS